MTGRALQRSKVSEESARRVVLTERDVVLLQKLGVFRYLSVAQVERLFFCSRQTTARRLRILMQAGYLSVFDAPGVPDRVVGLEAHTAELISPFTGEPISARDPANRRRKPKDYLFLKHFMAITDFRISLETACAGEGAPRLLGFIPEYLGQKRGDGNVGKYIRDTVAAMSASVATLSHTPDGVFALGSHGAAALFFLEVDRGTEVTSDPSRGVLKMLQFYLQQLMGSGYQRYQPDFGVPEPFRGFRALVATTSQKRLDNIRGVGGRLVFEPATAKRFIWLTTMERVEALGVLGPIWHSLDPADSTEYAVNGMRREG